DGRVGLPARALVPRRSPRAPQGRRSALQAAHGLRALDTLPRPAPVWCADPLQPYMPERDPAPGGDPLLTARWHRHVVHGRDDGLASDTLLRKWWKRRVPHNG